LSNRIVAAPIMQMRRDQLFERGGIEGGADIFFGFAVA